MPQLEFSIWLSNLIINWGIITILVLQLNSNVNFFTSLRISTGPSLNNPNNTQWPWT